MKEIYEKYKIILKKNYSGFRTTGIVLFVFFVISLFTKSTIFMVVFPFLASIYLFTKYITLIKNIPKKFRELVKYDNYEDFEKTIDKELKDKNTIKIEDTFLTRFYFYFTDNWLILLYQNNSLIVNKNKIISSSVDFVPHNSRDIIKLNIVGVKGYKVCDCPDDDTAKKIVKLINEYTTNNRKKKL